MRADHVHVRLPVRLDRADIAPVIEVLVAEYESEPLEGKPGSVTVVIKFDSKEALNAWYNSPEYQTVIRLRTDNSEGIVVSAGEFDLEKNLRILEAL